MIGEKEEDKAKALEEVLLVEGKTTKTTRIRTTLSPEMKSILVQFLNKNINVFTWSHKNMPGISPKVIEHKLNTDPEKKPIQQKRRAFDPEQN